jgi:DNA-binding GntR family transcriptional regulator
MKASQIVAGVTLQLESDIIFGRLHPFETLSEDILMDRFEVKRHVVRQALAELVKKGIVEKQAGRSAQVRFFPAKEVDDIYEVRAHLFVLAVRLMKLPFGPSVLAELRRYQRDHKAAVRAGSLLKTHHANDKFHTTLFAQCDNVHLIDTIQHYEWLSNPIRSYGIADKKIMAQSIKDHSDMIESIVAQDRRRLSEIVVRHILPGKHEYLSSLGSLARLTTGAPRSPLARPDKPATTRRARSPRARKAKASAAK